MPPTGSASLSQPHSLGWSCRFGGGDSGLHFSALGAVDGKGSLSLLPHFLLGHHGDGGEVLFPGSKDSSLKGNKFLTNCAIILLCSLNETHTHTHTQSLKSKL